MYWNYWIVFTLCLDQIILYFDSSCVVRMIERWDYLKEIHFYWPNFSTFKKYFIFVRAKKESSNLSWRLMRSTADRLYKMRCRLRGDVFHPEVFVYFKTKDTDSKLIHLHFPCKLWSLTFVRLHLSKLRQETQALWCTTAINASKEVKTIWGCQSQTNKHPYTNHVTS